MTGIEVMRVQGQTLAVFGPCAGRPCPGEAGKEVGCCYGEGWMLLDGWVEEWWSRSGWVAGYTHSFEGRGRVPG